MESTEGGAARGFKMQPRTTPREAVAVVERDNVLSTGADSIKVLVAQEHELYPGSRCIVIFNKRPPITR